MVAAIAIVVILTLVVGAAVVIGVRAFLGEESRTEERLHDPRTRTVAYAIPNGVDPVPVKAALAVAGFTSVVDELGNAEGLIVECETPEDRSDVRRIIQSVHVSDYDGADHRLEHVVFEDER